MKIIKTLFQQIVIYLILTFITFLFIRIIHGGISGSFFQYNFKESGELFFLIWLGILGGCISTVTKISYHYSNSYGTMIIFSIIGLVIVNILNILFWILNYEICWSDIEDNLDSFQYTIMQTFSNYKSWILFWAVLISIIFLYTLICKKGYIIFSKEKNKVAFWQIFSYENDSPAIMQSSLPTLIQLSVDALLVIKFSLNIIHLISCVFSIYLILVLINNIQKYKRLVKYYTQSKSEDYKLIFHEDFAGRIYENLIKNEKRRELLKAENIYIVPIEPGLDINKCIQINCIYSKNSSYNNFASSSVAYCEDANLVNTLKDKYAFVLSDWDELCKKIIEISNHLYFIIESKKRVEQIRFDKLTNENVITEEINYFYNYIKMNYLEFVVFDYSIKWLEIMNYIFSICKLANIYKKAEDFISEGQLKGADMKKWIQIRKNLFGGDSLFENEQNDRRIFETFNQLYKSITTLDFPFKNYSLNELFDGCLQLRDYTIGHGVFTFEINSSINLSLIDLIVYFVNTLFESQLLNQNICDLESLGWIVYYGEIPYFLYYKNQYDKEVFYTSFRQGSRLLLPFDISGGEIHEKRN